jgi:hypothetical protein
MEYLAGESGHNIIQEAEYRKFRIVYIVFVAFLLLKLSIIFQTQKNPSVV